MAKILDNKIIDPVLGSVMLFIEDDKLDEFELFFGDRNSLKDFVVQIRQVLSWSDNENEF